jgi:hypothetical protein
MREVLMHELRAHKISADRQAAYLLVMTDSRVPCPHCYARGLLEMLSVAPAGDGAEEAGCAHCKARFSWHARHRRNGAD